MYFINKSLRKLVIQFSWEAQTDCFSIYDTCTDATNPNCDFVHMLLLQEKKKRSRQEEQKLDLMLSFFQHHILTGHMKCVQEQCSP